MRYLKACEPLKARQVGALVYAVPRIPQMLATQAGPGRGARLRLRRWQISKKRASLSAVMRPCLARDTEKVLLSLIFATASPRCPHKP